MGDGLHHFGRYLLVERLGKGGMAEVYRALRQGGDGTMVAIKRLLPQLTVDPELVSMFLNEARLVAALRHPHIAQVLDLGRIGQDYFIALEYVAGEDLRALFARGQAGQPLPLPLLALMGAQVCDALDFAHHKLDAAGASMGIVHRDVSPENILVSFAGEAKLIDFGVAKVADGPVKTQTGVLKGKFCYMSPEQVLALPLDRRSNLFSMGVVLYELATGHRLFLKDSDFATLRAVAQERVVPPGDLNPDVPPALERVILKALARDRQQRYQWASEMAADLRGFLSSVQPAPSAASLHAHMLASFPQEYLRERQRQVSGAGRTVPAPPTAPRPAAAAQEIPELVVPELLLSPEPETRRARAPASARPAEEPELAIIEGQLIDEQAVPTRRWKRRSVSIPVKGRWWLNEQSPASLTGTVLTLSEGGAMLRTNEPIPADGLVELSIPIGFLRRVRVRGRVRWWHRTGQEREAGVEFEEPRRQLAG
ncbi:MAG TPA: serine/threonine-protein kinase [Myxococcales bacterium]|jgi:serine/threonine protein kinase